MKPINLKTKLLAFAVASVGMISTEAAAQQFSIPACTSSSSYANSDPFFHSCTITPKSTRLNIYTLALCQEAPPVGTTTGCSVLFSAPGGRQVTINGAGSSVSLADDISLSEGTYKYAVLHFENKWARSASITFNTDRTGLNGGTGKTCYTDTTSFSEFTGVRNMVCGASDASQFSESETKGTFLPPSSAPWNHLTGTTSIGTFDAYYLDNQNQLASISFSYPNFFAPTNSSNAASIWALQTFSAPPTITPETKAVDLGFLMTNSERVRFDNSGCPNGATECVGATNTWNFAVKFTVQ